MNYYTHNTRDTHAPCTFIKIIASEASAKEIGLSDDWFSICPKEVRDVENLCGCAYLETENVQQIDALMTKSGKIYRRYGRL